MEKCIRDDSMFSYIDAHSHFSITENEMGVGIDFFWPNSSDINEYYLLAMANGITQAMLMPCPSPQLVYSDKIELPVSWEERNGKISYFRQITMGGNVLRKDVLPNPYKNINLLLWDYVKKHQFGGLNLHFVPLLNLIFDEPEYLMELISRQPKAFKIHGISSGLDDFSKINERLLSILSHHNIPLIIHTDCFSNPHTALECIYEANNPLHWIEILERYGLRAMLTHGVRLCRQSIDIINHSSQFLIGMAPELLLMSEPLRLRNDSSKYMNELLSLLDTHKLVFDIDFPWNVENRYSYKNDEKFEERFRMLQQELGYCVNQVKRIANENAQLFFNLSKRKDVKQ